MQFFLQSNCVNWCENFVISFEKFFFVQNFAYLVDIFDVSDLLNQNILGKEVTVCGL